MVIWWFKEHSTNILQNITEQMNLTACNLMICCWKQLNVDDIIEVGPSRVGTHFNCFDNQYFSWMAIPNSVSCIKPELVDLYFMEKLKIIKYPHKTYIFLSTET